jgi:hypothetical protein
LLSRYKDAKKKTDALINTVAHINKGVSKFQEFMEQYVTSNTTPQKKPIQDKAFRTPPPNAPQSETKNTIWDMDESPDKPQAIRQRHPPTRIEGNAEDLDNGSNPESQQIERSAKGSAARKD